jgi:maleylacetate reductase
MRQFTYQALPMRVVFGAGSSIRLADRLPTSARTRVLVVCSPEQRDVGDRIAAVLRGRGAGLLTEAQMHVPVGLAERARQLAAELRADGCVAMGGAADLPHSSQAFA